MTMQRTPTATLTPDRRGLPPPLALDLTDMDRRVGWVDGDVIGFRGFGSAVEATHAAWVAHRTIARRLARRHGGRSVLIDTQPLALERRGDAALVLASGVPIATLLRPDPESPGGADSFGFELRVPGPADELTMRSMAYLAYRTLRKSGLRWAMWTAPGRLAEIATQEAPATRGEALASAGIGLDPGGREVRHPGHAVAGRATRRGGPGRDVDWGVAFLGVVLLVVLALFVPRDVALPLGIAAFTALALVSALDALRRWWTRRAPESPQRSARRADRQTLAGPARAHREPGEQTGTRRWARVIPATTVVSVAMLLLALAAPGRPALVLSAVGLAGLLGSRILAARAGWLPERPVRVRSRRPASSPAESADAAVRRPHEVADARVRVVARGASQREDAAPEVAPGDRAGPATDGAPRGAGVEHPVPAAAS